jgi:ribonuclease Z
VDLIFLGTGGSVPTPARTASATALRHGGEVILFDCGEGTQKQLMASSASMMRIKHIFITHLHGDHFLGLPGLVQSMSFYGRKEPLCVHGPEDMIGTLSRALSLGFYEMSFEVYAQDLGDGDVVRCDGYSVRAISALHSVPALSFVFEEDPRPGRFLPGKAMALGVREGRSFAALQRGESLTVDGREVLAAEVTGPPRQGLKVAISGDTRPNARFVDAARGCDAMVHEATALADAAEKAISFGHSSAAMAADSALQAKARMLFLNHISGRYADAAPILAEAEAIFRPVFVPKDLDEFKITAQPSSE